MTAASGILHKEYHDPEWAARGGRFHMMQLWVNLPAAHKMDAPGYQPLTAESMGKVKLDDGGVVTLVAGELDDVRGPARTVTPISLWDVQLGADESADLAVPDGHTLMTFVLDGELTTSTGTIGREEMGIFNREGDRLQVTAGEVGARFLVLGGKPIDEPVVFYGPFVMNTMEEIREAMVDFNNGKFGTLV
jgi:redox-sensitive bicupin YhaK (pirin superfamily)